MFVLAQTIILDTREAISRFDKFRATLPPSFEITTEEAAFDAFNYLADEENARGEFLDFLYDLKEELRPKVNNDALLDKFCEEMHELARAIWEQLTNYKIYSPTGTCWYYPNRLLGFDLVLELSDDEDSIREDLDDQEEG
jgi:hypothetical protein